MKTVYTVYHTDYTKFEQKKVKSFYDQEEMFDYIERLERKTPPDEYQWFDWEEEQV
jgi:hypothetical protein